MSPASSPATTTATPGERVRREKAQDRLRAAGPLRRCRDPFRNPRAPTSLKVRLGQERDHPPSPPLAQRPHQGRGRVVLGERAAVLPGGLGTLYPACLLFACFQPEPPLGRPAPSSGSKGRGPPSGKVGLRGPPQATAIHRSLFGARPEERNGLGLSGCKACAEEGMAVGRTPGKITGKGSSEELGVGSPRPSHPAISSHCPIHRWLPSLDTQMVPRGNSRPDSTGAWGQEVKGRPPSRDVALEVACCSLCPWHVGTECLLSAGHWAWRRGHRESEPGGGPTIAGQS